MCGRRRGSRRPTRSASRWLGADVRGSATSSTSTSTRERGTRCSSTMGSGSWSIRPARRTWPAPRSTSSRASTAAASSSRTRRPCTRAVAVGRARCRSSRAMSPRAALVYEHCAFCLDGTLIDSRADLTAAVNPVLRRLGLAELPPATLYRYVGDGARVLVERALGSDDQDRLEAGVEAFMAYYAAHLLDATRPYPGVEAALAALAARGVACSVLTNKPEAMSRAISTRSRAAAPTRPGRETPSARSSTASPPSAASPRRSSPRARACG